MFVIFLIAVGLVQASHAAYYGFATIHWRAAGLSDDVIGALWAEGVLAEIVLFAFSGAVVRRLGPVRLLLLGAAAGIVRWAIIGSTTDLVAVAGVQWLHSPAPVRASIRRPPKPSMPRSASASSWGWR